MLQKNNRGIKNENVGITLERKKNVSAAFEIKVILKAQKSSKKLEK